MRVDAAAVIDNSSAVIEAYLEKEPQVRNDFEGDTVPQMGMFYLKEISAEILTLDGKVPGFHVFQRFLKCVQKKR